MKGEHFCMFPFFIYDLSGVQLQYGSTLVQIYFLSINALYQHLQLLLKQSKK